MDRFHQGISGKCKAYGPILQIWLIPWEFGIRGTENFAKGGGGPGFSNFVFTAAIGINVKNRNKMYIVKYFLTLTPLWTSPGFSWPPLFEYCWRQGVCVCRVYIVLPSLGDSRTHSHTLTHTRHHKFDQTNRLSNRLRRQQMEHSSHHLLSVSDKKNDESSSWNAMQPM